MNDLRSGYGSWPWSAHGPSHDSCPSNRPASSTKLTLSSSVRNGKIFTASGPSPARPPAGPTAAGSTAPPTPALRSERLGPVVSPGRVPPPHRTRRHLLVVRKLVNPSPRQPSMGGSTPPAPSAAPQSPTRQPPSARALSCLGVLTAVDAALARADQPELSRVPQPTLREVGAPGYGHAVITGAIGKLGVGVTARA